MKRIGDLYAKIYDLDNLRLADQIARKGKKNQPSVKNHDKNREENLLKLHLMLKNKTFRTSKYKTFIIREPKERTIFRLPYFPDRILHHAIMNILEPIFVSHFTSFTYSCIKGKGISAASRAIKKALLDKENTKYCLKLDIKKFYPSIDHTVLKYLLRRKIKCNDTLWLLDEIIDSTYGLPIGNYLSQFLANFYLSPFDHWLKENRREKHCFRYADDTMIFSSSKEHLHQLLADIKTYMQAIKLTVKENYQIFPVDSRGVDALGYVFWRTHVGLRKSIKKRFARRVFKNRSRAIIAPYFGWAKHADCKHLIKKLKKQYAHQI